MTLRKLFAKIWSSGLRDVAQPVGCNPAILIADGKRESNFELMRIFAMFFIVAHHYVVNSSVLDSSFADYNANLIFLKIFGSWGKTAINPFVMMSGYFMCTSRLTRRRFLKIFLEWVFYTWVVFAVLALTGYQSCEIKELVKTSILVFRDANVGFAASFLWFYLGIPFYNKLISVLSRTEMYWLVGLLLALFVGCNSVFGNGVVFHHVFWYMTLYFVGSIIRLYPMAWMNAATKCRLLLAAGITVWLLAFFVNLRLEKCLMGKFIGSLFAIRESSCLVSFVIGLAVFLVFKNFKLRCLPWINKVASCMFGVLCLHAASGAMRQWLWRDCCDVSSMAHAPLGLLVCHAFLCVFGVMVVGIAVDLLRQYTVEGPLFRRLFKY